MRTKGLISSVLLLIALFSLFGIPRGHDTSIAVRPASPIATVQFAKPPGIQSLGANCYNVQVTLNVTDNLPTLIRVNLQSFYIYDGSTNVTVVNRIYYSQANNTITSLILFPNNSVNIQLQFQNFCLLSTVNIQVFLFYDSGIYSFTKRVYPYP